MASTATTWIADDNDSWPGEFVDEDSSFEDEAGNWVNSDYFTSEEIQGEIIA